MTAAALIACHMNVPYGHVLDEQDVWNSLRNGKLSAGSEAANEILGGMFYEMDPATIVRCAVEIKVPIAQVHRLYQETVASGFVRSPAWEQAVEALT